jgi:hypothetical protein
MTRPDRRRGIGWADLADETIDRNWPRRQLKIVKI